MFLDPEIVLLFWIVLSAGMCLTAVNLPSIWLLFTKGTVPEKVLRSVRSLVSLRSSSSSYDGRKRVGHGSESSANSQNVHCSGRPSRDQYNSTDKMNPEAGGYKVYALSDLESGKNEIPPVPPVGSIRVKDSVAQKSEPR